MTGVKGLYPECCHIFVLGSPEATGRVSSGTAALHRWDSAQPLALQSREGMQHGFPHQCYSKIRLQDPTLNTFLGRKRNFSVHWPSAKKCVYAAPSLRTVFDAAHKASLIPIRQHSKLLQDSPAPSSLDLELSMVCATRPVLMVLLTANIWLHARFLFWHCSVQIILSHHKIVQLRTSGPSIHLP